MQYFRNTDLANTYHVSVRAVSNWINATKQSRLDLTLHNEKGRDYVANTARNIAIIAKLVEERRKFRTTKAHKVVTPSPEFYALFSPEQIVDIISNLEVHREIPRQYNYFDGGADRWDSYSSRLAQEETANILKATVNLLEFNQDHLDNLLGPFDKVNIIDIGPGNALPVRGLIEHLLRKKKLGQYIAVDISPEMIEIARKNINSWFNNKVDFRGDIRDITYERIADIASQEFFVEDSNSVNLILFLGGTLGNFRTDEALSAINNSMLREDILVCSQKLDTPNTRRYFDFSTSPGMSAIAPIHRYVFELMNIEEKFFEVEMGFDEANSERFVRIRLNVALSIEFLGTQGKHVVDLNKDDTLLVWRFRHQKTLEVLGLFENAGFDLLHASTTNDGEYLLNIHRVKLAPQ